MVRTGLVALLAELNAHAALLDGGSVEVYSGEQPESPQMTANGLLLGVCALNDPAFSHAIAIGNDARIVAHAIAEDRNARANGKATWFRVKTRLGLAAFDGTISSQAGTADAIISNDQIEKGGRVQVLLLSYTLPM